MIWLILKWAFWLMMAVGIIHSVMLFLEIQARDQFNKNTRKNLSFILKEQSFLKMSIDFVEVGGSSHVTKLLYGSKSYYKPLAFFFAWKEAQEIFMIQEIHDS